jgi:hypothetical protein
MTRRTFSEIVLGISACTVPALGDGHMALPAIAAAKLPAELIISHATWRIMVSNRVGIVERRILAGGVRYFWFENLEQRAKAWSDHSPVQASFRAPFQADGQVEIFRVPASI